MSDEPWVMSDEWWVMSDEPWVMSHEWWAMSDEPWVMSHHEWWATMSDEPWDMGDESRDTWNGHDECQLINLKCKKKKKLTL